MTAGAPPDQVLLPVASLYSTFPENVGKRKSHRLNRAGSFLNQSRAGLLYGPGKMCKYVAQIQHVLLFWGPTEEVSQNATQCASVE